MNRRRWVLLPPVAGALSALGACQRPSADQVRPPLSQHDFYVWQQVWSLPLAQALLQAAPAVRLWRVRTLEVPIQTDADLLRPAVDWTMLAAARRPVIAVLRVAGNGSALPRTDRLVAALVDSLRLAADQAKAAAVPLIGIEIDHDCANSRLPGFTAWLAALREACRTQAALRDMKLSITGLPAWLESPALPALLRVPDESVLQVHAVQRPAEGLFDALSARSWARAWSAVATAAQRPFRLALPCYAHRVAFDERAKAVAVQSEGEAPMPVQTTRELELTASPREVERLLNHLRDKAPAALAGCVWFRLPTDQDQRAWRLGTWQALVAGHALPRAVQARLVATAEVGLFNVTLHNPGDADLDLPAAIWWPDTLSTAAVKERSAADGQQGYTFRSDTEPPRWLRQQAGWLRPRSQRVVGWLRVPPDALSSIRTDVPLETEDV